MATDMLPMYFMSAMGVLVLGIFFLLLRKKKKKEKLKLTSALPKPIEQPVSVWTPPIGFGMGMTQQQVIAEPVALSDLGKTSIFNRVKISMDALIFACVFVGFLSVLIFYLSKAAFIAALISGMMFIPIGVIIGAMFASNFRVKIMRRLTRKNYGMVKFIHSNKLIKPVIANLDSDIVRFADGVYILDKQTIKREGTETPSSDIIQENVIKFEEGIPTIYYDLTDIMPVDFTSSVKKIEGEPDRFRLPSQVSATLNKEIAVEKAKIMKAFRTRQSMFMLIIIALIVINVYFSYSTYTNNKNMMIKMDNVNSGMNALRGLIPSQPVATATTGGG